MLPGAGRGGSRRAQGAVAVEDGYREDVQSWLDMLRELCERGIRAPALAVGDGALGLDGAQ